MLVVTTPSHHHPQSPTVGVLVCGRLAARGSREGRDQRSLRGVVESGVSCHLSAVHLLSPSTRKCSGTLGIAEAALLLPPP